MSSERLTGTIGLLLLLAGMSSSAGAQAGNAPTVVAGLRSELVWQRTSPRSGSVEGPILYQLIFRSSATPGNVPAIANNFTLTNSPIAVNGSGIQVSGNVQTSGHFIGDGSQLTNLPSSAGGTVSSVGLSAPSSDFAVTGSPITGSGTLNLNWNVPPTNANTPNAIVKRDVNGNFSAGSITAVHFIGDGSLLTNLPGGGGGGGTVTSVGLTAAASDFVVTGSPITGSGTLNLNWSVPPTSANTPNSIVKRDANGTISVGTLSAQKLFGDGSGLINLPVSGGTVTSVGLSAPASDFVVNGSPITNNGTLNLNWSVPPTSLNIANAIVKRDASGNFNAGSITAAAITGAAVTGTGAGNGAGGFFTGGSAGSNGVVGTGGGSAGVGVEGIGQGSGAGVFASGGGSSGPGGQFFGGSPNGNGVVGNAAGTGAGVTGNGGGSNGNGVVGNGSGQGSGGRFTGGSTGSNGVIGIGGGSAGVGVEGTGQGSGSGGFFSGGSSNGNGVQATGGGSNGNGVVGNGSGAGAGVVGNGGGNGGFGVSGVGGPGGIGVTGTGANGVFGQVNSGIGTGVTGFGGPSSGTGGFFSGGSTGGIGIEAGGGGGGLAGKFDGDVQITGTLTATTKHFKIDHPLAPAEKYLVHAAIESSEVLNLYSGNVVLDRKGQAWVELPDWFEALNQDFRYVLTAIGAPGPNLYIAQEIRNHRFQIAGGKPLSKVSWQVAGIRHDAYMAAHPMRVEEDKPAEERGRYLHPELFGQPEEKAVGWIERPRRNTGRIEIREDGGR